MATPSQPATAGDVLEVYCAGLGVVSPALADGAAASLTTVLKTINPVTASVGGLSAQVLFADCGDSVAVLD